MYRSTQQFTPRVAQILVMLLTPLSEKQIARELNISIHTVHSHIKGVYSACRVNTRAELMAEVIHYLCEAQQAAARHSSQLAFSKRRARSISRQRVAHTWHVSAVRSLRASRVKSCEVS